MMEIFEVLSTNIFNLFMNFRYELNRAFSSHFRTEHNGAESDYTILVENQKVIISLQK